MSDPASDPAGAIRIVLDTRGAQVVDVALTSSRRTDFSRRLFAGHDVGYLLDTLPRVFSVCATAQSSAAVQAVEAALAAPADAPHRRAREVLVLAETAREHLFRILLGWSAWLGVPPGGARLTALGRMRTAWSAALYPGGDAFRPGGGRLAPDADALRDLRGELDGLVTLALGVARDAWRDIADAAALHAWASSADGVAAAMLRRVTDAGHAAIGRSDVAALPAVADAEIAPLLGGAGADRFVAAPQWDGAPRETTALQRQAASPLVAALAARHSNGLLVRQVARLVELAATVDRIAAHLDGIAAAGGTVLDTGVSAVGVAQVEAARGRLVHRVELVDGEVADYRILAPTEWNFHPRGGLAQGLLTLPADAALPRLAQLLVDAVDPCVESRIEVRQG
ncbi:MAG: nickel-dependent hydrogenase large subunit [Gammaproteobacteria bacterium]|nr:nickel-dependent hydrogenase large subunit [Gammaproteobacteria bacterium]